MYENLNEILNKIINIEKNDINNENANMASETPAGQMMKIASEVAKIYALENLVSKKYSDLHRKGYIHIHDLDYYASKTTTCLQYDLEDLFENGFQTKHGFMRAPQSITTYATLATIIFQTNQNEQHGGQAIPAFDFYMAKGVLKSFRKYFLDEIESCEENIKNEKIDLKKYINNKIKTIKLDEKVLLKMSEDLKVKIKNVENMWKRSYLKTKKETFQAMEGFIHNLNTMHSRGGNQVVFSSINYGTDTSEEGRMVIVELLRATEKGLGKGETPIFPIQIFKVKEGLNYSEKDYNYVMGNYEEIMKNVEKLYNFVDENVENSVEKCKTYKQNINFETKNFDLLLLSTRVTSKRLFPNYVFLDTNFNKNEKWDFEDEKKYKYEIATMGCRTRVFDNVNGEKTSIGRGNLSFTSINLPRIAIEVKKEIEKNINKNNNDKLYSVEINSQENNILNKNEIIKNEFKKRVKEMSEVVAEQLFERYNYQKIAFGKQFPFMKANNLWKGMEDIDFNEKVGDVINSGSLSIGFVGGYNAMYALFGESHGKSQLAYETLIETIEEMNKIAAKFTEKYHLNYSVLGTPAESLAGRFLVIDRKEFGVIENVTDKEYYVNSFHIDVKEKISIFEKIKKEAPFHNLTRGGHITYVELDGEAKKNTSVILKIVKAMKDNEIGYGSINHPVDKCRNCGIETIIYDECPCCKSKDISRVRRITGYLTGDLSSWNSAKRAEERDRVKHGL